MIVPTRTSPRSSRWARVGIALALPALLGTSMLVSPAEAARPAKKNPDLVVNTLGSPAKAAPGKTFKVATTVKNKGKARAGKTQVVVVLSRDRKKSGSDKRVGSRAVGALKPGKKSKGKVAVRLPKSAKGRYFLIACVTKVKGERGRAARNNCRTASRALTIKAANPSFPEKFVGTASVTFTHKQNSTPTQQSLSYHANSTLTMRAEAVFTRVAKQGGGYDYVSTGEIEYSLRTTTSGGGVSPAWNETCTTTADGETEIGPFRTTRYASGSLHLANNSTSLAPGNNYRFSSSWDFAGLGGSRTTLPNHTDCSGTDRGEPTSRSTNDFFDLSDGWLPPPAYKCDNYPTPKTHNVRANGSLSGNELCIIHDEFTQTSGSTAIIHKTQRWTWNFKPMAR